MTKRRAQVTMARCDSIPQTHPSRRQRPTPRPTGDPGSDAPSNPRPLKTSITINPFRHGRASIRRRGIWRTPPFSPPAPVSLCSTESLRQAPPFADALRQRLALRAAAAGAKILRRREDEAALRDAAHLAVSENPGPAGRLHQLWRSLAGKDIQLDVERFQEALRLLDFPEPSDLGALVAELRELAKGPGDPVTLAAKAAARAFALGKCPEVEIFALWTADLLLAIRLGWEKPAPLLMTKILAPSLRRGPAGRPAAT